MGHRLISFDFGDGAPPRPRSPYPLESWMDGSIWCIRSGADFVGTVRQMQSRLHHYAYHRGYWVRTRTVVEEGREGLVFQFTAAPERLERDRVRDERWIGDIRANRR